MRILVVEDEKKTADFIRSALDEDGHEARVLHDGKEALQLAVTSRFDAIVLDIMLPELDGLSVLRQLRARACQTPVLLLSARGKMEERVEGLNLGADDYLPKPFALAELLARVRALLRRPSDVLPQVVTVSDLMLDTITRKARRGQRLIELTEREYRLLEFFLRSAGRVCARRTLLEQVWDYTFDPGTNLVDVHVKRLRKKIEAPGERPLLHCVRGIGYVLNE